MCVEKLWSFRFEIQNLTLKIMLKMIMDDSCDWALTKLFILHFLFKDWKLLNFPTYLTSNNPNWRNLNEKWSKQATHSVCYLVSVPICSASSSVSSDLLVSLITFELADPEVHFFNLLLSFSSIVLKFCCS